MAQQNTNSLPPTVGGVGVQDGVAGGTDGTQVQQPDLSTSAGMTDLRNQFAQSQQQNTQSTTGTQQNQNDVPANQNPTGQDTGADDNSDDAAQGQQDQPQDQQASKDQRAFAAMRVQNKQLSDMLGKIAKANGIEFSSQEDLMEKLNDDAIGRLAERQGTPKELLQRMEILERNSNAYLQQQMEQKVTNDFLALQAKYGLDEQGLLAFAKQLGDNGVDPFTQDVDIESMYVRYNLDTIVDSRVQAAVEAALKRDAQAGAHSSQPSGLAGSPGQGQDSNYQINSVAGLTQLLASYKQ